MNGQPSPPTSGLWLLRRLVNNDITYEVLGDFEEIYAGIATSRGSIAANRWFWIQVARSLVPLFLDSLFWNGVMLKNDLILAGRTLKKKPFFAFINTIGLAIGMAGSLLIGLHVYWV